MFAIPKQLTATCLLAALVTFGAHAADIPEKLPRPDQSPGSKDKPVKVYILSGQSNMVGMGEIDGGGQRWGKEFHDIKVSVYPGDYDPSVDYDKLKPSTTMTPEKYGGVKPTALPDGGVRVVRGKITIKDTGVYQLKPGYGPSTQNIMTVNGKEVHRHEPPAQPVYHDIKLEAGETVPFRIIFTGSDASGLGWIVRKDIPGNLTTLVKHQGHFQHLIDEDGNWLPRQDVMYKGVISSKGQGPLVAGCAGKTIGPELGFGHIMGYYHDEPVLIIKSSQGNRSLSWDFLPPGSKRYTVGDTVYGGYKDTDGSWPVGEEPEAGEWYAGKQYDDCFQAVHEVLDQFGTLFPQYKDQGYEVAGFVWWQGHKDGSDVAAARYEYNMVNFIKALRKEFDAPDAPFVLGTVAFHGWGLDGHHKTVAEAQLAVSGETGKYPEFKGNVLTVEMRDFWRGVDISPKNQDYHYNRNAETYYLVGDALGRGMVKLLEGK